MICEVMIRGDQCFLFVVPFPKQPLLFSSRVAMPDASQLYSSTDTAAPAAPFVPGPALYVAPSTPLQVLLITFHWISH